MNDSHVSDWKSRSPTKTEADKGASKVSKVSTLHRREACPLVSAIKSWNQSKSSVSERGLVTEPSLWWVGE